MRVWDRGIFHRRSYVCIMMYLFSLGEEGVSKAEIGMSGLGDRE